MYAYNLRFYHCSIRIQIVKDEKSIEIHGLNQFILPSSIELYQIFYLYSDSVTKAGTKNTHSKQESNTK